MLLPTAAGTLTLIRTPTSTRTAALGKGLANGAGKVDTVCGKGIFTFVVRRQKTGGPVAGFLVYIDKNAGVNLRSGNITSMTITRTATGKAVDFSGTCTNNGAPCTFSVHAEDNDKSGRRDVFEITTSFGYSDGGPVRFGNIKIF